MLNFNKSTLGLALVAISVRQNTKKRKGLKPTSGARVSIIYSRKAPCPRFILVTKDHQRQLVELHDTLTTTITNIVD